MATCFDITSIRISNIIMEATFSIKSSADLSLTFDANYTDKSKLGILLEYIHRIQAALSRLTFAPSRIEFSRETVNLEFVRSKIRDKYLFMQLSIKLT